MPITTAPPKRKAPTEAEIEAVINRGGDVATVAKNATPDDDDTPKHLNVRLTVAILRRMDALRSRRPRKPGSPKLGISQHDWVVEAVLEKIEREERKKV